MGAMSILLFSSSLGFAAFNKKPVCSNMTQEIWNKNQAGCMRAFKPAIESKQVEANSTKSLCDCVADELVNKTSCEDMRKFDEDKNFEKQLTEKITKSCKSRFPIQKLPATNAGH
ncbi:MAG: hypothetical protein ACJ763_11205 [Bdellovibrionia bacterium]